MKAGGLAHTPVRDIMTSRPLMNGVLAGVISQTDIVRAVATGKDRPMTAVHEVMSTSPVTVMPTTSVGELLVLFDRHDFNALPVLDESERLTGIVSKLDVLQLLLSDRLSTPSEMGAIGPVRVADLMRRRIVSIEARDSIAEAGALMFALKLRSLPVVEQRAGRPTLVGMLSRGDVLRGLRHQLLEGSYVRQAPAA